MCTPECNWQDCANNEQHLGKLWIAFDILGLEERKQFLEKNNDYFSNGAIEEVIINGKKIRRHTKGWGWSNSGWKKKYCEWYKFGVSCSEKWKWKTWHNNKIIIASN